MRTRWLLVACALSALLSGLHYWASTDFLYWRYVWIDVPIHLLGGLAIGTFVAAFLNSWRPFLFIFCTAALIIGWEVFEYFLGSPKEANFAFDSALDVLMGTVGVIAVYMYARASLWRSA